MRSTPLLAWILTLACGTASATCPTTRYSLYGAESTSSVPIGSAGAFSPQYPYDGDTQASWNATIGTVRVSGYSGGHHGWTSGSVSSSDDFELLGPPSGQVVRVTATLALGGNFGGGTLQDAFGRSVTGAPGLGISHFNLAVDFTVGTPQRLTYAVSGSGGGGYVEVGATLLFLDLPAGMSIVSCRGYQAGQITATRPTSWGRLKQIYR